MRVYLKAHFDLHQTQDCQRKGAELSRLDRVRLQYQPTRIAEVLISNFQNSIQDAKFSSNLKVAPSDDASDKTLFSDSSGGNKSPHVNSDSNLAEAPDEEISDD